MSSPLLQGAREREGVLAALPDIAPAFAALYAALWQQTHLPGEVLECCRLRLAQLHGSSVELAREDFPLSRDQRDKLAHWHSDDAFGAGDRACLAFAEVYAMDAQAITDDLAQAVKDHYGDAGLVLLIEALGIFDGMARLSLLWGLPVPAPRES